MSRAASSVRSTMRSGLVRAAWRGGELLELVGGEAAGDLAARDVGAALED